MSNVTETTERTDSARTDSASANEVDIEAVAGLAANIQEVPTVAETTWQASVAWKGGFRSEATIRDFGPTASDEPPALGGTDTGPNPVEQLLGALGNCLAVGYAANATAAGISIESLDINLSGDLDLHTFLGLNPDGNAGFAGIKVDVDLRSDATEAQLADLHAQVTSTSPVGHTLARPIPVSIELV